MSSNRLIINNSNPNQVEDNQENDYSLTLTDINENIIRPIPINKIEVLDEEENENLVSTNITICSLIKTSLKVSSPLLILNLSDAAADIIANNNMVTLNNQSANAANIISTTQSLVMNSLNGILIVISNLTSQAEAAKQDREVGTIYRQSLVVSTIIAAPAIVIYAFISPLLRNLGQEAELAKVAQKYFNYFIIAVPGNFILTATQQMLAGLKKQTLVSSVSLTTVPVFYLISHALSQNNDDLEISGIAIAYALRYWIQATVLHLYLLLNKEIKRFKLYSVSGMESEYLKLKEIIKIGLPIIFNVGGTMSASFMLNLMAGWNSQDDLVKQNISTQYFFFSSTPSYAFAQSTAIIVAGMYGEKKLNDIRKGSNVHLALSISTVSTISIIVLICSSSVADIFASDDQRNEPGFYNSARIIIAVTSVAGVSNTIRNILTCSLRGISDTAFSSASNIINLWAISVPSAYLLSKVLDLGTYGIVVGQTLGLITSIIPLAYRWYKKSLPSDTEMQTQEIKPENNNRGIIKRCLNSLFWSKNKNVLQAQKYNLVSPEEKQTNNNKSLT